jgi:hypothetical protein
VTRRQKQSGGTGSTNAQAGRDIIISGITAADAIDIAENVFWKNFLTMGGAAEQVLRERVERFARDFVDRLQAENPAGLSSMADPDMLRALYTAQEGYACSGDNDLEDALIDLLVDRAGQEEQNLKTLVLNQAIATVPKLTKQQRAALAVIFFVKYSRYTGQLDLSHFYDYTNQFLVPFVNQMSVTYSDFGYMQYAGVGSISLGSTILSENFYIQAYGYFVKGFKREEAAMPWTPFLGDPEIFIPCIRDCCKLQINARSLSEVEELAAANHVPTLVTHRDLGRMYAQEIRDDLISRMPSLEALFDAWEDNNIGLSQFDLTAVGIAIAHASQRKVVGDNAPLEVFLR